jgi:hypothetical protein
VQVAIHLVDCGVRFTSTDVKPNFPFGSAKARVLCSRVDRILCVIGSFYLFAVASLPVESWPSQFFYCVFAALFPIYWDFPSNFRPFLVGRIVVL